MTDTDYDFEQYPFTPLFPDGIGVVEGSKPKQLDVSEEEAIRLALAVLEDPFFRRYLKDNILEKLNSTSYDVLRAGLNSARGFQYKIEKMLEEKSAKPEPTQPQQTRVVTPLTDETRAKAKRLLDSAAGNKLPQRLRVLLSRQDEHLVAEAISIATDILQDRHDQREAHKAELNDLKKAHEQQVAIMERQIGELETQNLALRQQASTWMASVQHRVQRLKGKVARMVAAAREDDEPMQKQPDHDGDVTPHLVAVEAS